MKRELSFRDFVAEALYDPWHGYYPRLNRTGLRSRDFATSNAISPVFSYAIARLGDEFLTRVGDASSTFVDVGCGDGSMLSDVANWLRSWKRALPRMIGVDRVTSSSADEALRFTNELPSFDAGEAVLIFSNELFDAFPFARLVQREEGLRELWVAEEEGSREWLEKPAPEPYSDYFREHGVELETGQYADVCLEWRSEYDRLCNAIGRGMVVTFDYGFRARQLFDARIRRFGTAAAYRAHQVHRDLLDAPGEQDLTAHINFDDLLQAGESRGFETVLFSRQAAFLLSLGIAEHPLFAPTDDDVDDLNEAVTISDARQAARRLVLPDGIGEDIRVLVQTRGMSGEKWSFLQHPLSTRR